MRPPLRTCLRQGASGTPPPWQPPASGCRGGSVLPHTRPCLLPAGSARVGRGYGVPVHPLPIGPAIVIGHNVADEFRKLVNGLQIPHVVAKKSVLLARVVEQPGYAGRRGACPAPGFLERRLAAIQRGQKCRAVLPHGKRL